LVVAEETKNVISPGGNTQKLQSPSLEGVYQLVKRAHDEFHWQDFSLPQFFQKRGLDDKEGLRDYPYRDDSESIFAATKEFVTSYIKLYYASDADVTGDDELKAWLTELASQDGGRIRGLPNLNGIDDLILFVTQVIDRASTSHAAVNYSVWNALSFAPNMPAAGYASGPVEGKPSKEEDLYKMMPPLNIAKDTVSFTYMVGHFRVNQLGHYPLMNFADHRVMPLIKVFKSALADVENTIKQRNKERPVAYELLLPSNVPASLQV
jgi:arachidonate 15-lipoxygenase